MLEVVNNKEILLTITVYGYAPEFWPTAAYRKQGRTYESERLKEIKCPNCGKLLLEVSISRRLELFRYKKRVKADCHEYRKCKSCYENIGIIFRAG